jgi:hypothetical protein
LYVSRFATNMISVANTGLNDTHFNSLHTYRVEWELPGTKLVTVSKGEMKEEQEEEEVSVESKGYIRWYVVSSHCFGVSLMWV